MGKMPVSTSIRATGKMPVAAMMNPAIAEELPMLQAFVRVELCVRVSACPRCWLLGSRQVTLALVEAQAASDSPAAPAGSQSAGRSAAAPTPASAGAVDDQSPSRAGSRGRDDDSRPSRSVLLRRLSSTARAGGSDGWYLGMAGITLALAVCGGVVAAARRFSPQGAAGEICSRLSREPFSQALGLPAAGRPARAARRRRAPGSTLTDQRAGRSCRDRAEPSPGEEA